MPNIFLHNIYSIWKTSEETANIKLEKTILYPAYRQAIKMKLTVFHMRSIPQTIVNRDKT